VLNVKPHYFFYYTSYLYHIGIYIHGPFFQHYLAIISMISQDIPIYMPSFSNEVEGRFPKPGCSRFSPQRRLRIYGLYRPVPAAVPANLFGLVPSASEEMLDKLDSCIDTNYLQCASC
jgi:hypothetical protein